MTVVFWASLGVVWYTYFGFYFVLRVLAWLKARPVHAADHTPAITVIVPVHNGAAEVDAKLDNLFADDYPAERMQIIIVSDGSTDDTAACVRARADAQVLVVELPERVGKETAQRTALQDATGDVCVFTDVGARLERGALRALVAPFADPDVGATTGRNVPAAGSGESAFIRYDMALRRLESSLGSVVGLSGALNAVRRDLCDVWPEDVPSDFYMLLATVLRGYRGIYVHDARVAYGVTGTMVGEFQRKVRTIQRGIAAVMRVPATLAPWRTGLFAVQLLSHKLLRWCVPFFMAAALGANVALAAAPLYRALLLAHVGCYGLAVIAVAWPRSQDWVVFRLFGFWLVTNVAIVVAWLRYMRYGTVRTWLPTVR